MEAPMPNLGDDLLRGARAIGLYVLKKGDKPAQRHVYHKYQTKSWPIWKDGAELISRKSLLDRHFNPPPKIEAAE
jgi:hypothetical protein